MIRARGFTLIELLVAIGIIAILIGVLLPALSKAHDAANTVRCASNLHVIGQGIFVYAVDYKGVLPPSNTWRPPPNGGPLTTPSYGTIHWSSFIYSRKDLSNTANIYLSPKGWEAFQCPSVPDGGLPPANTYPGNSLLPNEASGAVIDAQAPRLAYTLNEALCPREFFVLGATAAGAQIERPYHYVQVGSVRHSAATILATEMWGIQKMMVVDSMVNPGQGMLVSAARRPISGFTNGLVGPTNLWQLPNPPGAFAFLFPLNHVTAANLTPDPCKSWTAGTTVTTTLDWVGRNHDKYLLDNTGFDKRRTNFLYLDGHVETKGIRDTLNPVSQWGNQFYSLTGGDYVQ